MPLRYLFIGLFSTLALFACQKDQPEPAIPNPPDNSYDEPTSYSLQIPPHFPQPEIPSDNPMTEEGVRLGRALYYENLLSKNGPLDGLSCSSCHHQGKGFTSPTTVGETPVLPHVNLLWNDRFLWKSPIEGGLEDAMRFELEDFFETDLQVLRETTKYPDLFGEAYGEAGISMEKASKALAQFMRTQISSNAKFDQFLKGYVSLSPSEMRGFDIFNSEKGDCFHCHSLPLMTDSDVHNIGLDSVFTGADAGYYTMTGDPADKGKFKTPTLRNVALRETYMHDGRFQTLMEVVERYDSEVKNSNTLDPIMTKPGKENGLELTQQEKQDLVNFLKTLTDSVFLNDSSLREP